MPAAGSSGKHKSTSFDHSQMEDEDSSERGGSQGPEDGGGKASGKARKAQNRIAQREFRLRRQQYVRDLEVRVEVLSGDKEERVELMTLLLRNLLKENKDLRDMIKSMASFVGEGLGSCLPRLGLSAPQLDAILNRADTDSAYDAFIALKASREMEAKNPGLQAGLPKRRASSGKRKRASVDDGVKETSEVAMDTPQAGPSNQDTSSMDAFAYLFPDLNNLATPTPRNDVQFNMLGSYPPTNPIRQPTPGNQPSNLYSIPPTSGSAYLPSSPWWGTADLSGFGLTVPPATDTPTAKSQSQPGSSMPDQEIRRTSEPDVTEAERQRQLRAAVAQLTSTSGTMDASNSSPAEMERRRKVQDELKFSMEFADMAERKTEACQLITYHLNNFRMNHSYNLPPSLRPTRVQRTIPHEHVIDAIIFPSMRDRMILLRGRYDLVEAFHGMLNEFNLHGQDVLDHHNWEISEKWLNGFRILVDEEVYGITNKWRVERGDLPLKPVEARLE